MDYAVFESRVMELLFKTDLKLTPQLVAFRVGCPVELARTFLEHMTTAEILVMEVDPNGLIHYDVPGRPAPTNEPLSWLAMAPQVLVQRVREKSTWQAATLGLFLGPLGMLPSTRLGSLVMTITLLNILIAGASLSVAVMLTSPICALWAAYAVQEQNRKQRSEVSAAPNMVQLEAPPQRSLPPPPPRRRAGATARRDS